MTNRVGGKISFCPECGMERQGSDRLMFPGSLAFQDKTIHHHRLEFGLPIEQDAEYSDISHEELDSHVQQNIKSYMYTKF